MAKIVQEKFFEKYGISSDPFKDIESTSARHARDSKRKELQCSGEKPKTTAASFNVEEHKKLLPYGTKTHLKAYNANFTTLPHTNWLGEGERL